MIKMRRETRDALSPLHLRVWRKGLASAARALVQNLSADQPVELITSYAQPLCLTLAAMVTKIDLHEAERLRELAEPIAASAAEPYDAVLKSRAKSANAKIRSCFRPGPEPLRDSGFVALAHTLPCLLANAWFALLESPEQWAVLHSEPRLVEHAVEELLRCSGLPRILFRRAIQDIKVNGAHIRKGERIVLKVRAANLDPAHFPHADQLDVKRTRVRHLALGAGIALLRWRRPDSNGSGVHHAPASGEIFRGNVDGTDKVEGRIRFTVFPHLCGFCSTKPGLDED